jgi:hypothetical protein
METCFNNEVAAHRSTRTHMVNDGDLRISNPAKIAEVDRFGSDPEFPQHDGVQRWSNPCSYTTFRRATREGET